VKYLSVFCLLLGCGLILIGLVPVATNCSITGEIQVVTKDLRIALAAFNIEYGHFPGQSATSQSADIRLLSTGPLIDCLLGQNAEWNRKEIKFVDLPKARNGKYGYVPAEGTNPCRLVDLWGNPYVILLDTNGDGKVQNPDTRNSDPAFEKSEMSPPPDFLPVEVAIYSYGKDGIEGTADDIVSWRSTLEASVILAPMWLLVIVLILLVLIILIVRRMRAPPAK